MGAKKSGDMVKLSPTYMSWRSSSALLFGSAMSLAIATMSGTGVGTLVWVRGSVLACCRLGDRMVKSGGCKGDRMVKSVWPRASRLCAPLLYPLWVMVDDRNL